MERVKVEYPAPETPEEESSVKKLPLLKENMVPGEFPFNANTAVMEV